MEKQVPIASVGLPVFNGENFVADAIECMLSQTLTDWELVISDNRSTDRTLIICRDFAAKDRRIRVYQNDRNMGMSPNYNRVFELSRGKYFKWITHDDLFDPEFIECCVQDLEADPSVVLAFPKLLYVDAERRVLREQTTTNLSIIGPSPESRVRQLMRSEAESTDIFWSQFGLIPRRVLEQTRLMGPYNGSDQVLLLELALHGNFNQVERGSFLRREHAAASTLRTDWTWKQQAKFVHVDDTRRIVFPYCRMLREHLHSIQNSSMSARGKIQCAAAVSKRFCKQWKYFAHEILESPLEAIKAN